MLALPIWRTKIEEIERILIDLRPAVLGLSEANLRSETDVLEVKIPNYKMLTTKSISNLNIRMSRLVTFVREDLKKNLIIEPK